MKKALHILAVMVMTACSPFSIHVSTVGDDSASGKKNSPLATRQAALGKASEYSLAHQGRKIMQNTCTLPNMSKRSMIVDRLDR